MQEIAKCLGWIVFFLGHSVLGFGGAFCLAQEGSRRVVQVTLDGVRWQEIFKGVDPHLAGTEGTRTFADGAKPMPWLSSEAAARGVLLGNHEASEDLRVSNSRYVSLPGYQTLFSGFVQRGCNSNYCGAITVETLPEKLIRKPQFTDAQFGAVSVLGSWEKIIQAATQGKPRFLMSAGLGSASFPEGLKPLAWRQIEERQNQDQPKWRAARKDIYTWELALQALELGLPESSVGTQFLSVSLNDSDEWGHLNRYEDYLQTLRQYDRWIQELVGLLDQQEAERGIKSLLLVTTDHGRGEGRQWQDHGPHVKGSDQIWMYATQSRSEFGKELDLSDFENVREPHLDFRPSIEAFFGVPSIICETCGVSRVGQ